MPADFDLAIVGSGFAGALTAMIARRLGRSVVMLERGRHPRFAIGESSTPLANVLWAELARRYDLPALAPLAKYGPWRRAHPEIACGLKRGFSFFHHRFGEAFADNAASNRQLLVAASTNDDEADSHWYRPDFDAFLVDEARRLGVEYLDETTLDAPEFAGGLVALTGRRRGQSVRATARFVVDASGPRGFLFRALGLPEGRLEALPLTQGLFTHFAGVGRFGDGLTAGNGSGGGEPGASPPFPVDDAALHHVFDGGWIWVLRFSNGLTSAGVAARDDVAEALRFAEGAPAWERLLARLPSVRLQFEPAQAIRPFVYAPQLPFLCNVVSGPNWALLPYAAGFIDPLLSTGFPLTLFGIGRLAAALEHGLDTPGFREGMLDYDCLTRTDLLAAERLVGGLYAAMADPPSFTALALLYFAAASFSEVTRRLGRPHLAPGFLLHRHPHFGPAAARCCALAQRFRAAGGFGAAQRAELLIAVQSAIEPINLMRLGDAGRRNWYPVKPEDFLAAAPRLNASAPAGSATAG